MLFCHVYNKNFENEMKEFKSISFIGYFVLHIEITIPGALIF